MNRTADVVIIGGGIMGMSIAYHLAVRGCSDVVLLEKEEQFGTGATGTNAGGVRHQFSTKVNIELSRRSIEMIEQFPQEMDQEVDVNLCGYLFLLDNDRDLASFKENIVLQHSCGIETELLNPSEIARIAPQIQIDDIISGAYCGKDGITDPHSVL
ncbi:MAG TPA: FAD-binding oxidoreductase, partial [Gemmatimonadetes bacterium]|nr:FAD-binding oxidoreductase [Gemmatimonadota bacterium]